MQDAHIQSSDLQIENPGPEVRGRISFPFQKITALHLKACWAYGTGDVEALYKIQCDVVEAAKDILNHFKVTYLVLSTLQFTEHFQDQNWMLALVLSVCSDLRVISARADKAGVAEAQEKAAPHILNCFRICAADA